MPKLFLAGVCPKYRLEVEGHNLLLSFADSTQFLFCKSLLRGEDFFHNFRQIHRGDRVKHWKVDELILDSGAYTYWTQKRYAGLNETALRQANQVTLQGYIKALRAIVHNPSYNHGRYVKSFRYIALDVIPGEKGNIRQEEVKLAAKLSWSNYLEMRAHGLNPMPVFHEGDPHALLDELVNLRRSPDNTICLAGTISRGKPELRDWVENILNLYPDVRFHGLAMTQEWVANLPLDSVDSTTWLTEQRTPRGDDKQLCPEERRRKGIQRIQQRVCGVA